MNKIQFDNEAREGVVGLIQHKCKFSESETVSSDAIRPDSLVPQMLRDLGAHFLSLEFKL